MPRSSAGQRRVARAGQVAVRQRCSGRRADETCVAVTFVAVFDPAVRVVCGVTPLDTRRGGIVGVLGCDNVGEDAGRDIDGERIYRGPVERDGGTLECDNAMCECEHGGNDDEKSTRLVRNGGKTRSLCDRCRRALMKCRLGDSQLYATQPRAENVDKVNLV